VAVFLVELTKACRRSRKYPSLGGGIVSESCQNRRAILIYGGNGHDSTTLKPNSMQGYSA
ncbi:hypothetical protein, partial [Klebsiella michiganensis]|uniref:hypothetical protein n=1 Tax=Klebsiella michiganensis TaxID=1134687 RepID=UPI001CCE0507